MRLWREDAPADPLAGVPTGPVAAARRLVPMFGASGEGKTTYMAHLHRQAVQRGVSATWVDTTGDNAYVARFGAAAGAHCAVVRTPEGWLAHVVKAARASKPYNLVVIPDGVSLDPLWSLILHAGNCLVSIDETEEYAPASAQLVKKPFGRMISRGRNRQVSVLTTVRLPIELNGLVKGLATSVISFRQENEHYAQWIAEKCFHGRHPRAADLLMGLPQFGFLRYTPATGRLERGSAPPPGAG